ncbi:MAG: pilus assembly protein TadG-related protein [Pseudomonadota bacterium]
MPRPSPFLIADRQAKQCAQGPRSKFGRLARDERGAVMMLFGLLMLPLVAAIGLAIDAMVSFTVENRIQRALDAAGLAAGRAATDEQLAAQAQQFFDANFENGPDFRP